MEVTFAPRDIIQINDARIASRNFAGREGPYTRKGDRSFALAFSDNEFAQELLDRGWNVTIKPPKKEGEPERMYLKVKVKFNDRGPAVYLVTGNKKTKLTEDTVGIIDDIDIRSVDLDIRPYDWETNGKTGRTAYLQAMRVVQEVDRFAAEDCCDIDDMEEY